jgi:hypothetical protein
MFFCLSSFVLAQENNEGVPGKDEKVGTVEEETSTSEMPATLDEEKSKQISNYFDEALQNYRDILEERDKAEMETTEKRIDNNKKLLEEQKDKLTVSKTSLRKIQVEYIRRFLILKNFMEQGKIDKKTYEQELGKLAREYKFQLDSLSKEVEFRKTQMTSTVDRLKTLQELERMNKILVSQKEKKTVKPSLSANATDLEKLVQKLSSMGCFEVKNFWQAPEIK